MDRVAREPYQDMFGLALSGLSKSTFNSPHTITFTKYDLDLSPKLSEVTPQRSPVRV